MRTSRCTCAQKVSQEVGGDSAYFLAKQINHISSPQVCLVRTENNTALPDRVMPRHCVLIGCMAAVCVCMCVCWEGGEFAGWLAVHA